MPIVYKRRGNRMYAYEQRSYREGKKVRTWSKYLGPLGGIIAANTTPRLPKPLRDEAQEREDRALAVAERAAAKIDAYQRATFGETGQERADREKADQWSQERFLAETAGPKDAAEAPAEAVERGGPESADDGSNSVK